MLACGGFDSLGFNLVALLAQFGNASRQPEAASFLQGIYRGNWATPQHVQNSLRLAHVVTPMGLSLDRCASCIWRHGGCQPYRSQVFVTSVEAAGV